MKNMNINIENYEIVAVDYFDNNLSDAERAQFEAFLDNHPEIKNEIIALDWIVLPAPSPAIYHRKEELIKKSSVLALNGRRILSIAAVLLLLIISGFIAFNALQPSTASTSPSLVDHQKDSKQTNDQLIEETISNNKAIQNIANDANNQESSPSTPVINNLAAQHIDQQIDKTTFKTLEKKSVSEEKSIASIQTVTETPGSHEELFKPVDVQPVENSTLMQMTQRQITPLARIDPIDIAMLETTGFMIMRFELPEVDSYDGSSLFKTIVKLVPSSRIGRQKQTLKEALLPEYMQGQ